MEHVQARLSKRASHVIDEAEAEIERSHKRLDENGLAKHSRSNRNDRLDK
jgi:hypothetical protein